MRYKRWLKGSAYTVRLPVGCRHCARGGKLVLLVTGECSAGCYYCPLSTEKRGRRLMFADELRVERDEDILTEARLIGATGTGITGGDPLSLPSEVGRLIRLLKGCLGERHHIHLYTSSTDQRGISAVGGAGLDEIRFHPPVGSWARLEDGPYEKALSHSLDLGMQAGFEIPVIPGTESGIRSLLGFANERDASFVNLNELEFSESNWKALRRRGFAVKDDISSAVAGSEPSALRLLSEAPRGLPTHYCSASFKDGVQLRRRIARRGRRIRRALDLLTEDGTLVMGVVESDEPERLERSLRERYALPGRLIEANPTLGRVEIAAWVLEEIADELEQEAFIIEEYPTADRLEVERERVGSGTVRRR